MSSPQVTVEQGTLRGYVAKDIQGNNFFKFQGIPYAKPPLGDLRFKAPQPPEKWSGVRDATKEGDICYSRDPMKNNLVAGSEDCLFLNVYTNRLPTSSSDKLRPVLFWIHGGGFINGSGNEEYYGPDFLVTEDIVLVTINYRLGILGFLSFEDPSLDVPGNTGFKDQVMALKWVQKNISKFGGDPNNVTIFGQSAGAVSAHLHILSPMSKGLFHKAISQSGCVFVLTVHGDTDNSLLAEALGLDTAEDKAIYNALMAKSVEEILEVQETLDALSKTKPEGKRKLAGWVIEKNAKDPFLSEEPVDIISSGRFNQVPYMAGHTSCEVMMIPPPKGNISFEPYIPWYFGYTPGSPESKAVADQIEKFYFGPDGYNDNTSDNFYDLISDHFVAYSVHESILRHIKTAKSPTYVYRVSVESQLNFYKQLYHITHPGVAHLDDIGYLFHTYITPEIKPGSLEDVAMRRYVKLWSNFAKSGNPTPDKSDPLLKTVWPPVTKPDSPVLDIGEELIMLVDPDVDRVAFWEKLYAESPGGKNQNHN